ncbi:alpha/beta fold hydrolase [Virgisporangium aurantiacum]|uniref:Proline iminopeptidase n=1 Tax=Virgisporangium aurantiacum TaxID=175570 RepID=A0A8J3ZMF2_9ACTN|nr:alpha/beta hydrolase [Virgisporangium aurantiacum]GIJ64253.1 proline iminopeptidase [Virgisporangium aurantiacum]
MVIGVPLAYRKLRQRRVARALGEGGPAGIAEGRYVTAGGVDQWIQLRGADRSNPILLILAGSGLPMEPFTPTLRAWERHFTVVLWDRRDVGRTRGRNGRAGNDTWTFDRLADDGIEVVEWVRRHLGQDKVILVGHSQGSIVGVTMARRRPDLFHAYVGTGQIADMARNEDLTRQLALDRARAAGNRRAVRALERHAPPYRDARTWITKQRWSMATDPEMRAWQRRAPAAILFWPGYSLADAYRCALGALFLPPQLFTGTMACTPETLGTRFEVPVLVIHGDTDAHTLPSLAEEYLEAIDAPVKAFVRLPGTGHLSMLADPDQFLAELLTRVRPLAVTA